jgi:carboxyl-terminal processing protease
VHSSRIDYKTEGKNGFESGRVTILIDESAASASEILAGAVQDWDRGIIVGRRSYGKGLVQEQYDMDDGAALRLTIAKYYTPSGRCIQRPYAKGREAYADDFVHRFETGELTVADTTANSDTTKYYTANKRIVYGGGGIKPDIYVHYDTAKLTPGVLNMLYSSEVYDLVWGYYMQHRKQLIAYKDIAAFRNGFIPDDLINAFYKQQDPTFLKALLKVMNKKTNRDFFATNLKAQLARILFKNNGYYTITTSNDDVLQRALHVINSPQYLTVIGR